MKLICFFICVDSGKRQRGFLLNRQQQTCIAEERKTVAPSRAHNKDKPKCTYLLRFKSACVYEPKKIVF